MAKPVVVNPNYCKPLSEDQRGKPCTACGKPLSKWLFGKDPHAICSLCFLYKTFWGRNRAMDIAALAAEVEKQIGKPFLRDAEGNLMTETDATRIAGAILMTSHMIKSAVHSHLRREAVRSMMGDEDGGEAPDRSEAAQEGLQEALTGLPKDGEPPTGEPS